MRDVYGAIAFLANHPRVDHDRIHVLEFSWGGTHVLDARIPVPRGGGGAEVTTQGANGDHGWRPPWV
ncbi:MAG: hypothetical protein RL032_96 [Pseudomonadota bacterium]|jgi:dienelactone hydrolase